MYDFSYTKKIAHSHTKIIIKAIMTLKYNFAKFKKWIYKQKLQPLKYLSTRMKVHEKLLKVAYWIRK